MQPQEVTYCYPDKRREDEPQAFNGVSEEGAEGVVDSD